MLGIDAKETIEFVSKKDVSDPKTIFTLRSFLNRDKLKIGLGSTDGNGKLDMSKFQDKILDIIQAGVIKIKNLAGQDYDFTNASMGEEFLEKIQFDVLSELFEKIMAVNFPSEQEEKN